MMIFFVWLAVNKFALIPLQGGQSSGYENSLAEKGSPDETYTADSVALFRISGTSVHNNKAVQVEAVCGLIIELFFSADRFCLS
jgi:hypothetical protein